jgi:hypothetical protein
MGLSANGLDVLPEMCDRDMLQESVQQTVAAEDSKFTMLPRTMAGTCVLIWYNELGAEVKSEWCFSKLECTQFIQAVMKGEFFWYRWFG